MEAKTKRTRRRHSAEFQAEVVAACRQPGVSVSGVALANGLNANLLRRWIKESTARRHTAAPLALPGARETLTAVPVTRASAAERDEEAIRIDIRRAGIAVQLAWPATRVPELNGLLKELLR